MSKSVLPLLLHMTEIYFNNDLGQNKLSIIGEGDSLKLFTFYIQIFRTRKNTNKVRETKKENDDKFHT